MHGPQIVKFDVNLPFQASYGRSTDIVSASQCQNLVVLLHSWLKRDKTGRHTFSAWHAVCWLDCLSDGISLKRAREVKACGNNLPE